MDKLQATLLECFYTNKNRYTTSTELSETLDVSSRTIKRRIQTLNEELLLVGGQIESSKQGYRLIVNEKLEFSKYINRLKYIREVLRIQDSETYQLIHEILLSKYITQEELASKLYVSRSTIGKLMVDARETLTTYEVTVNHRPHYGYYLVGKEQLIRSYMVKFFFLNELDVQVMDRLISQLNRGDTDFITRLTVLIDHSNIFRFRDQKQDFIKYLIVSILRSEMTMNMDASIPIWERLSEEKKVFTEEVFQLVNDALNIDLSQRDRNYLISLMSSETDDVSNTANDEYLDTIVDQFFVKINMVYGEDFSQDDALRHSLIQHLHASYSRLYVNVMANNPLISLIKSSYIESYNYAILCGEVMREDFNISMSEDDFGYIALHFVAAKERAELGNNFNVILVCGSGVGTAELLRVRLCKEIPSINIIEVCSSSELSQLINDEISLIISTVPLDKKSINKPIIQVSSLIQQNEIEQIKDYLKNYQNAREVKDVFSSKLFYPMMNLKSKAKVLDFVMTELSTKTDLTKEELNQMLAREKASSTEINEQVALPHCIVEPHHQNVFLVLTTRNPINWGRTHVQLIIVAVIAKGTSINKVVFPLIYKITSETDKIEKLITSTDFNEFISIMFSDIPVDYK